MAIQLKSTRELAKINGLKMLVFGGPGAGKTTLCKTAPGNQVIISAESGLLSLRDTDIPVIEVSSIADVHDAYQFITESSEGKQFDFISLDSISEIGEKVLSHEKAVQKDGRAAYGATNEAMTSLVRGFRDLPERNVYFSCKQEKTKDEQTGAILYGPSMPGAKLGQQLPYFFDFVFALRAEKSDDGQIYRTLQTGSDYQYACKDRSGALDLYEAPDLAALAMKVIGG